MPEVDKLFQKQEHLLHIFIQQVTQLQPVLQGNQAAVAAIHRITSRLTTKPESHRF
jgi:hypothetical protein